MPSFCKSAMVEEPPSTATSSRRDGTSGADGEDDGEPFEEKMKRLVAELQEQRAEAGRLDAAIARNLAALGWPPEGS